MTNQAHLQPFIDFLHHQAEYKFINNDQWMGFYRFSLEVSLNNLSTLLADLGLQSLVACMVVQVWWRRVRCTSARMLGSVAYLQVSCLTCVYVLSHGYMGACRWRQTAVTMMKHKHGHCF